MADPKDLIQNAEQNLNQHQEQHLELTDDWVVLEKQDLLEDQKVKFDQNVILNKNTFLEKDAEINIKLNKEALSQQERKQMKDRLSNTSPEQISEMNFDQLANWARESVLIDSANPGFKAITNQMLEIVEIRKQMGDNLGNKEAGLHYAKRLGELLTNLANGASLYLKSHNVSYKAWWNKGKCRLALAEKILNEKQLLTDLGFVEKTTDFGNLSPNFSLVSLKVENDVIDNMNGWYNVGDRIRSSETPGKTDLYKKLSKDIGGVYERDQFMDIFQGQYIHGKFEVTENEEHRVTNALDQYYNQKNSDPLFQIMDEHADTLLKIKLDADYFDKDKMLSDPRRAFYLGYIAPLRCSNLMDPHKPLGKAYFENLKKKNPKRAEKILKQCDAIALYGLRVTDAIANYYGLNMMALEKNAKPGISVWENQVMRSQDFIQYIPPMNLDPARKDFIMNENTHYVDEDNVLRFRGKEQFYEEMKSLLQGQN